ncbi:MAG: restriction endonuclease subunit S [Clostridia bacterium]|nr:restriction endonuclease subunit S [Clostridia bacterium]
MKRKTINSGIPWIGEIPEGWGVHRIKHHFSVISGATPKSENMAYWDGDIPWITPADFRTEDKYVSKGRRNLTEEGYASCGTTIIPKGSIVFSKRAPVGSVAISTNKLCTNQGCLSCVAKDGSNVEYFYFLMSVLTEQFDLVSTGTTFKEIALDVFCNFELPYPSEQEQNSIVSFLNTECARIDAVIEKTRASIEEYKKLKQAVITEAVTKGIRPGRKMKDSGIEWIGEIPEEWELSTIGKKIVFEGGSQPPLTRFIHEPREGYIRLIQNRDYKTDEYITYVPIDSVYKFCDEEDVMIGRYGPPTFVLHRGLKGAYNVALMKAIPIGIEREWMYFFLQEETLISYIDSFSKRAAGQDGVNPQILKKYPLPLPPNTEQQEIAEYLHVKEKEFRDIISKKELLISELNTYKKAIIFEYVTGKKEVSYVR